MKKSLCLLLTILFGAIAPAHTKSGEVTIPDTASLKGEKLVLNGVGDREEFWMDMCAGALYPNSKSSNAIINANEPVDIKVHIVSKLITSDKRMDAVNEGFNNSTKENSEPFHSEIICLSDKLADKGLKAGMLSK